MKKIHAVLFIAFCIIHQSCHVGRFFIYNFSDIRDYKKFPSKQLHKSSEPFNFKEAGGNAAIKLPVKRSDQKAMPFEKRLDESGTIAFMVIRNDTIIYDWVRKKYDRSSIVPSFSVAKSFVSALIGIAIQEGAIKSTSEPITNYIDYLDKEKFGKITIQHLLDMQSGIKFIENYYNPFGAVAKYYYGVDLKKYMKSLKIKEAPGKTFEYISLNPQLLALILEKATGKTPTEYLQEKIWTPLQMEFDASWSTDSEKNNTEKAFCCINARARDYAKFGRLYLNNGNWNGKQVIPESWVKESVNFTAPKNNFSYSNQWWHTKYYYPISDTSKIQGLYEVMEDKRGMSYLAAPSGDFFAQGHLGQFIYVYPESKIVIVRLGKKSGNIYWPSLMREIAKMNRS